MKSNYNSKYETFDEINYTMFSFIPKIEEAMNDINSVSTTDNNQTHVPRYCYKCNLAPSAVDYAQYNCSYDMNTALSVCSCLNPLTYCDNTDSHSNNIDQAEFLELENEIANSLQRASADDTKINTYQDDKNCYRNDDALNADNLAREDEEENDKPRFSIMNNKTINKHPNDSLLKERAYNNTYTEFIKLVCKCKKCPNKNNCIQVHIN